MENNFRKHSFSDIIMNRELGFSHPTSFTHHFYASQVFPFLSLKLFFFFFQSQSIHWM